MKGFLFLIVCDWAFQSLIYFQNLLPFLIDHIEKEKCPFLSTIINSFCTCILYFWNTNWQIYAQIVWICTPQQLATLICSPFRGSTGSYSWNPEIVTIWRAICQKLCCRRRYCYFSFCFIFEITINLLISIENKYHMFWRFVLVSR
jgi:hypothetical protein